MREIGGSRKRKRESSFLQDLKQRPGTEILIWGALFWLNLLILYYIIVYFLIYSFLLQK